MREPVLLSISSVLAALLVALHPRPSAGASHDGHLEQGKRLMAAGDYAGARAALELAAAGDVKDPRPLYLLGTLREERPGEHTFAIKDYEEALARDPRYAPAHNRLGALLF